MTRIWLSLVITGSLAQAGCQGVPDSLVEDGLADTDAGALAAADAAPPDDDDTGDGIELACSIAEIQPILQCVFENCLDEFGGDTFQTCITSNCAALFLGLSAECMQCVVSGISDPSSALDVCVSGFELPEFPPS